MRQRGVQPQQRNAAQAVVPEQQPARIEAVGQPAGADGADHVEHADHGQQPGAAHLAQPVVGAGRDQVRTDQAVGRGAADEERSRQQPEVAHPHSSAQRADRVSERVHELPRRLRLDGAVGHQPHVGGVGAQEHERDRHHHQDRRQRDHRGRGAPAVGGHDPGQQRQEHELAAGVACGQHAGDQAPAGAEPAVGHDRGQRHGNRAGRAAHHQPPQQIELPRRRHLRGQPGADRDRRQRDHGDTAQAEPLHDGGRERRAQAVHQQVHRHGTADQRRRPAELVLKRQQQHARRGAEPGRRQQHHERGRGDHPRVVHPAPEDAGDHDRRIVRKRTMTTRTDGRVSDGRYGHTDDRRRRASAAGGRPVQPRVDADGDARPHAASRTPR